MSDVGYLLGFRHATFFASGPVASVEEILVRDDVRGNGIGRALMAAFEGWAREHGCVQVSLATRRAADFYRALGYDESARYFARFLGSVQAWAFHLSHRGPHRADHCALTA